MQVFTVVVTQQEHLDSIQEYKAFLKPFLDNAHIAFCRWQPEGEDLRQAVPELYDTVSRHERWRMILVCDEEGLAQKNPFDIVHHQDPAREPGMEDAEYMALRRQARFASYEQAAQKPMVRLMTWLCQQPLVTAGENPLQEWDPEYLEFGEYLAQARYKAQLRQQILGDYIPQINLPAEIICVAKRCFDQEEHDIGSSWSLHTHTQYSRFYEWNLYYDKMRYLLFDILPKSHRNHTFDYIRFLYALMVLAENEIPLASLNQNRVYALDCQNDEQALRAVLGKYDAMLAVTQEEIQRKIRKLKGGEKPRLSDRDARAIFCSNVTIPVATSQDFDHSTLYVPGDELGLSTNCPRNEADAWDTGYQGSKRALGRYMKMPRRALKKNSADLHRMNVADLDTAGQLNEFQLEDVSDFVGEEELRMVGTPTSDLYDVDRYLKEMETQNKRINTIIERRMTKRWTVTLGLVALLCYLIGFIPMFLSNMDAQDGTLFSLLFMAAGGVLLAVLAVAVLWCLKRPLKVAYSDYNGIMKGIVNDVEGSLTQYSKYLSHACNMMRGSSVLNFRKDVESPEAAQIRVLKKHETDILCVREELHEIFGSFLPEGKPDLDDVEAYPHDFFRPQDFAYPMPYSADQRTQIEFFQSGNLVQIPVDFIKAMRIRREELHD